MRHVAIPALLLLSLAPALGAQSAAPRPTPIALWATAASGALGDTPADIPTITVYRPEHPNGAAIVICPGGGYSALADYEGHDPALWLNKLGITAVVLTYRLGPRYHYPAPFLDAARAVRYTRAHAAEWQLDTARIGIMGFSAGGHLAATLGTHFDSGNPQAADPIDRLSSRPAILVLAYPVISMTDSLMHAGSRLNLLGPNPTADLIHLLSNETQVTAQTPPTFLFATMDDPVVKVQNSVAFADALRRAGVQYELHLYPHGPHGVGLAQDRPELAGWTLLLEQWLVKEGFAGGPSRRWG
ncbi:MAG TPA: alpha/beta hydrolase [Gemmatimonadales bacterium]|jgi:acetyl esterase/lipase